MLDSSAYNLTLFYLIIPPPPFKKGGTFHALFSPPFLKGDLGGLKIRLFKDKAPEKHYEPFLSDDILLTVCVFV